MKDYESDHEEVNRQVELLQIYEELLKLENEIKKHYWAYSELNEPKPYNFSLPMDVTEVKRLLKYMYALLYHLKDFLKRTQGYDYYRKYIDKHFEEVKPHSEYYGFSYTYEDYLKEKQLTQLSSFNESKLIKDAELLAEISGDKSLVEKAKKKVEWSKLSTEEKLCKIIDEWYQRFMENKELSKQEPDYVIERIGKNHWRLRKR